MGGKNLVFVFALAACGGGTGNQQGGVGGGGAGSLGGHLGPACTADSYSAQVVAICKTQHPPPPAAGQLGANCGSDGECVGQICLMPFESGQHYCTQRCASNGACPDGYSCQNTMTSYGSVCYQGVCLYAGADSASCVTELNTEAIAACMSGCDSELATWLACIAKQPRLCSRSDAHTACGIERGQLDSCCRGCNSQDL